MATSAASRLQEITIALIMAAPALSSVLLRTWLIFLCEALSLQGSMRGYLMLQRMALNR